MSGPIGEMSGFDGFANGGRLGADDAIGAASNGFRPFGAIAERDAGNAEIEGFLLDAAGIGEDFAGVFLHGEHFEEAERRNGTNAAVERKAGGSENLLGARVDGEEDGEVEGFDGTEDGSEALAIAGILGAVKREEVILLALELELLEVGVGAFFGEGEVLEEGVVHDVSGEDGFAAARIVGAADAFAFEVFERGFGRDEEELAEMVGDDAVLLLGHMHIAAAAAGFDMGERDLESRGEERTGESGVGVAIDDDPADRAFAKDGLHALEHASDLRAVGGRADTEIVLGLGNGHLLKEELGDFPVVVLTGVDDAVMDKRDVALFVVLLDGATNGCELDELRASADNADPGDVTFPARRAVEFHMSGGLQSNFALA